MICDQDPGCGLSCALIQTLAVISWSASTTKAATKPTIDKMFPRPSPASSSSSSPEKEAMVEGADIEVPSGVVGV